MKLTNKKGFTLAELLIVIAIIAILIAIAIPVFSGQLDNAKLQADHSNLRSAYAMVQTANLVGAKNAGDGFDVGAYYQTDGTFKKDTTNAVAAQAGSKHKKTGADAIESCQTCVVDCATILASDKSMIKVEAYKADGTTTVTSYTDPDFDHFALIDGGTKPTASGAGGGGGGGGA